MPMIRILILVLIAGLETAEASEATSFPERLLEKEPLLTVAYRTSYQLGFLTLFRPARVRLLLNAGAFQKDPSSPSVPCLIVHLEARPRRTDAAATDRIFFRSTFTTVLDTSSYQVLAYRKRVEEHIFLLVFQSRKDYEETAFFHRGVASGEAEVLREDFLTGTSTRKQFALSRSGPKTGPEQELLNLPALLGNAVFHAGYFDALRKRTTPVLSELVTQSQAYHFVTRIEPDRTTTPLTGRVRVTRVITEIALESLGGEVAPFSAWLAAPDDLPETLRAPCRRIGIHAFPAAMELKFSLGALKVEAERFVPNREP